MSLRACTPENFLKLHVLRLNLRAFSYIGVILTLALHVLYSYNCSFVIIYFKQCYNRVTFIEANDPVTH